MKVCLFKKNNSFVVDDSDIEESLKEGGTVIENPNLFGLEHVPSYFLAPYGNEIREMTRPEKMKRLEDIKKNGLFELEVKNKNGSNDDRFHAEAKNLKDDQEKFKKNVIKTISELLDNINDRCLKMNEQQTLKLEDSKRKLDHLERSVKNVKLFYAALSLIQVLAIGYLYYVRFFN